MLKRILIISIATTAGLMLSVIVAVLLILTTESGRVWLAETGLGLMENAGGYQIGWSEVSSPAFDQWRLQSLSLSQDRTLLMELHGITLQWQPDLALIKSLTVQSLEIDELIIHNNVTEPDPTGEPFRPPVFPLTLEQFSIRRLSLSLPDLDHPESYRINGNLQALTADYLADVKIALAPVSSQLFQFNTEARVMHDGSARVSGWYSEPAAGRITSMLGLPEDEPFAAAFRFSATTTGEGYTIAIHDAGSSLRHHELNIQGNLLYTDQVIRIPDLRIEFDESRHSLTGRIEEGLLNLHLQINDFALASLADLANITAEGTLDGAVDIGGEFSDPSLAGHLAVATRYQSVPLQAELSGNASLTVINLEQFRVDSGDRELARAAGTISLEHRSAALDVSIMELPVALIRSFGVAVPADLNGRISGTVSLRGDLLRPDFNLKGGFNGRYRDTVPVRLSLAGSGQPQPDAPPSGLPDYSADLGEFTLQIDEHTIHGNGRLLVTGQPARLTIQQGTIRLAESNHYIRGTAGTTGLDLALELNRLPLDLFAPLLDTPVSGYTSAKIALTGPLAQPDLSGSIASDLTYRQVPANLEAVFAATREQVQFSRLQLVSGEGRVNASGVINLTAISGDLDVNAENIDLASLRQLGAAVPESLAGVIDTRVHLSGDRTLPTIQGKARFQGHYQQIPLDLEVAGNGNRQEFTITQLLLTTDNNGRLTLQGEYRQDGSQFEMHAANLDAQLLPLQDRQLPAGMINLDMTARGSLEQPDLQGKLQYNLQPNARGTTSTLSGINADINLADNRLHINLRLAGDQEQTGQLDLSLPWRRYYQSFKVQSYEDLQLSGDIHADLNLQDVCLILVNTSIHDCSGLLTADLSLGNTFQAPRLNGTAELSKGRYENLISGSRIDDIDISFRAEGNRLAIARAAASDSEQGTIRLEGGIRWDDSLADHEFEITVRLQDAHLLRRYDMDGSLTGALEWTGSIQESLLAGDLEIMPLTIYLEALLQENIPTLNIVASDDSTADQGTGSTDQPGLIRLDIEVAASQQAYLRGPGLNAELQGSIRIGQTLDNPSYSGVFSPRRGTVKILGKTFNLTDGEVRLENDSFFMLITAVHQGKEIEVRADLSGSMEAMQLKLSSIPALPEDEIISHLLFNKSSKSISPLQAVRLANSISRLKRSGKPLYDPLTSIEKTLAIDRLNVEDSENGNGYSVGVGKYLHEKVYVEVETGTGAGEPWQGNVQIELLPNLNLENAVNNESGFSNIELEWKKDY